MKIGVTGASGYIGNALMKLGAFPISSRLNEPENIKKELEQKRPDVVLHLAAKSDVDWCQAHENSIELGNVNLIGTNNIMLHSTNIGIPCVLMSTGQIWKGGFWEGEHRENDKYTPPVNQYGISKLAAEVMTRELFFERGGRIIRSSFVFDAKRLAPKIDALRNGETIHEPTFIKRSFIHLEDLARLLLEYCKRIHEMPYVLHLAGRETISWYDFMYEVACQYMFDRKLVKPRRKEVYIVAPRPGNAGLDTSLARSLGFRIPDYKSGIERMRHEI